MKLLKPVTLERLDNPIGRIYRHPDTGVLYPSVTTVVKHSPAVDHSHLDRWRARIGAENAEQISVQARRRGTSVHTLLEDYIKLGKLPSPSENPVNAVSAKQVTQEIDGHIDSVFGIEFPLHSDTLNTAGSADLIAEWDGEPAIVDFKTSTREKRREWIENYFIQETAYSLMFAEMYGIRVRKIVTVIVCDTLPRAQVFVEDPINWYPRVSQIFVKQRDDSKWLPEALSCLGLSPQQQSPQRCSA